MYCPKCGNEISDNSRFCPKCGANLEASRAFRQAQGQQSQQSWQPQQNQNYSQMNNNGSPDQQAYFMNGQAGRNGYAASGYAVPAKKKRSAKPAAIILVLAIIAVVAVVAFNSISVSVVKNTDLGGITVGEAFDQEFTNPKWKAYISDGEINVKYSGDYTEYGETHDVEAVFDQVDFADSTCRMKSLTIDGVDYLNGGLFQSLGSAIDQMIF